MRYAIRMLLVMCGFLVMGAAQAKVIIDIDLTRQSMNVTSGSGSYTWPVSTARSGYVTPHGSFAPYSLQTMHYSRKYHHSPMPHSIFFAGGYAIHGTYSVAELGRPASHGCIRLSPEHAAQLFQMVKAEGAAISISGVPPHSTRFAKAARPHHYAARTHRAYGYAHYGRSIDDNGYERAGYERRGYAYGGYDPGGSQQGGLAYAPVRRVPLDMRLWQSNPYEGW